MVPAAEGGEEARVTLDDWRVEYARDLRSGLPEPCEIVNRLRVKAASLDDLHVGARDLLPRYLAGRHLLRKVAMRHAARFVTVTELAAMHLGAGHLRTPSSRPGRRPCLAVSFGVDRTLGRRIESSPR